MTRAFSASHMLLVFACAWVVLSLATQTAAAAQPRSTLSNPAALIVDPLTHSVYAVDTDHNTVIFLDEATNQRTLIPVAQSPIALALDAPLHRLFVVCAGAGLAQAISTTNHQVIASIPTDRHPYAIAADPVRHQVFVTNTFSNVVTVIDGGANTSHPLPLGSKDTALVDPLHGRVYFSSYEDHTVTELDETSGAVRHLSAAVHTWALAGDWQRSLLYAAVIGGNQLLTLSLQPGTAPLHSRSTPAMPDAVLVTPEGQTVIASYLGGSITVFSGSDTAAREIPTTPHPVAMALLPSRHLVVVVSSVDSTVTLVDLNGQNVLRSLQASTHPFAIVADPDLNRVYTAGYNDPLTELVF